MPLSVLKIDLAPLCNMSAVVTPGLCNTATNTFTLSGTIALTNNATGGIIVLADGLQSTSVSVSNAETAIPFSVTGLLSDGSPHLLLATLSGCGTTSTTYTAPQSCSITPLPTLSLEKLVDKSKAKIGDVLTYTIVVTNSGTTAGTNVVVRDSSTTGLTYLANSATAPVGTTFIQGLPFSTWTIGSINAGQSLSLTFQARVDSSGILYNKATIPGDTATVCTSVPFIMCAGDSYEFTLTAPTGRSSYKWYKDNVEISGQTTNVLTVTGPGTYSLAVDNVSGKCPDFSCCPFIIEEDSLPTFQALALPATCAGNQAQANGKIVLSSYNPAYTYQYSLGSSFNEAAVLSGAAQVIPAGGVLMSNLASPATTQAYTIRVYNASGCYTDVTVLLLPTVCGCPPEVCVPYVISQSKRAKRIGDPR
ncbi:DUF11 domain-containing protein [Spirosoma telluris]|uniref:DUF11 domain-containing protein n=1 Tax=Spirosoma telluris TaxID=2183553 RepID=UPI002FC2C7AE